MKVQSDFQYFSKEAMLRLDVDLPQVLASR